MRAAWVMTAGLAVACSEHGFSTSGWDPDAAPQIAVSPRELSFGEARVGQPAVTHFTIANQGDAILHIDDIRLPPGDFAILTDISSMILQPGGTRDIDVAFEPVADSDESYAVAVVVSDDAGDPEIPVYLLGNKAYPELVLDPPTHDFGVPGVGCVLSQDITLRNVGGDDLVIDEIRYEADGDLVLEEFATPVTLAPGSALPLELTYTPTYAGPRGGTLTVVSNDPTGDVIGTHTADAVLGADIVETFEVPVDPAVDLVFAIDHSCSMWDDAEDLGENFGTFIDRISEITDQWQAAVVTRDDGCFDAVVTPEDDDYEARFAAAVEVPTNNRGPGNVGDLYHDLTEALLTITRNAFQQTGTEGCNADFVRPGVLTHIVYVSDEPDHSPEGWTALVGDMLDLIDEVRMSAVAGPVPTGCETADPGVGYAEAVTATGGEFLSICDNWGGTVDGLAQATIDALFSFRLAAVPVVDTLVVVVDGELQTTGWRWDEVNNSVVFERRVPGGATVLVSYSELVDCDT